ncbi:putative oxidoreductase YdhV [subsurface metagenome]
MRAGYHGKLMEIDLGKENITEKEIDSHDVRKYLLGSGLAVRLLLREAELNCDPLSPKNILVMMVGLLTGTTVPCGCKMSVCAKSPLTGIWNEATVGGHFPAELKFTGYDGLVIRGKAEEPVYLWIQDGKCEIRNAEELWGKDTYETSEILKRETDEKARVASIGQAGENLCRISSITFDGAIARIGARGGIGAVMGSKNLKAVVCRGRTRPDIADRNGLIKLLKEDIPKIKEYGIGLREFGTAGGAPAVEALGDLPIKNWALGDYKDEIIKISGQRIRETIWKKNYRCYACPIGCAKIIEIEESPHGDPSGSPHGAPYGAVPLSHGPEYETVGMLGSNCLNSDLHLLTKCNELCNRYGMDTISTGSVLGFAMECFERGMITKDDTGGLEIGWGDGKAMIALINQIAKKEGFGGEYLADGVKRAAEKIGKGSEDFAVHTKGLEYPAHDPRGHFSMAPNYATAVRGGCHLEGLTLFFDRGIPCEDLGYVPTSGWDQFDPEGKARICYDYQNMLSVYNPLGLCKFLFIMMVGPKAIARWINKVCGWDMTMEELMKTGERLFNLKRVYDIKLGITRKDDKLPKRLLEPKPDGNAKGMVPPIDRLLEEVYQLRGWDDNGIPRKERLEDLGLPGEVDMPQ